jgi:hypothetical protein
MTQRFFVVTVWTALCLAPAAALAQNENPVRTAWGHPNLEGIWTNTTLILLQRPPELASKALFTPEEAAAYEKQRVQATNADRPLRAGEVGAYNDAFFERGTRGVTSGRTSPRKPPRERPMWGPPSGGPSEHGRPSWHSEFRRCRAAGKG